MYIYLEIYRTTLVLHHERVRVHVIITSSDYNGTARGENNPRRVEEKI